MKNPKNFSKTLKLRFQNMKCMNVKGLDAYQVKKNFKNLEETLRNNYWSEMREFGREIREVLRERSREMRVGSHKGT